MSAANRQPSSDRRGTLILVGAGIAMLAVLILVVVLVGGGDDDAPANGGDGDSNLEVAQVDITGDALPVLASGSDPAVGEPAPAASGVEFGGNPVDLVRDGQPTMIVFAAHWCPHCQAEIPVIVDWMEAGGSEGLDVVLVATATDRNRPNYPPSDWLARERWRGRVLLDDEEGSLGRAYGLDGYPFLVFVDADGNVTGRASGELPPEDLTAMAEAARA